MSYVEKGSYALCNIKVKGFSYFLSFGSFIKTEKLKVLLVAGQVIRLCRPQSLHIYNRVIFYPT